MSNVPAPRRKRYLAAAVAFLTAAAMTLVLAPMTPANAAKHHHRYYSRTLFASQANVLTSTGQRVRVDLTASEWGSKGADLHITVRQGAESHTWYFPSRHKYFDMATNGRGELVLPKSAISPFGKIKLKIRKAGKLKAERCTGPLGDGHIIGKRRHLKVSGTFWFKTKSGTKKTDWGKIGSKTAKFKFKTKAKGLWTYSYDPESDCGYVEDPCDTVSWNVERSKKSFRGDNRKVIAQRDVSLHKPRHATRTDVVTTWASSATLTQNPDKTASFAIQGNGGALTGSATMTGKPIEFNSENPCGSGMGTWTYTRNNQFTNGTPALRAHEVFGGIAVGDTSSADVKAHEYTGWDIGLWWVK